MKGVKIEDIGDYTVAVLEDSYFDDEDLFVKKLEQKLEQKQSSLKKNKNVILKKYSLVKSYPTKKAAANLIKSN